MIKNREYYYPRFALTIDKHMISFIGRLKDLVYEISKPTKWGFRPYIMADNETEFIYCFNLFEDLEESINGIVLKLILEFMNLLKKK